MSAGQEVLDVAAGNGNVAVLAAEEGAAVVASDLTPAMVELGRARTAAEGLDVEWVEADAEALPFDDGSFDCVTSCFGAMFAPRPEVVASELFRVVRPGNTVGMANWTPEGFFGRSSAVARRYQPLPAGVPAPILWGDEDTVRARFEGLAGRVAFERRTLPFASGSAEELWDFFTSHAGPQVVARETMDAEDYAELTRESLAIVREHNMATDGSLLIELEYLLVVARRRG
ncbi:MAG: class I SAM-dependent methyltransferase [Thermoleophilaceae bacterium]